MSCYRSYVERNTRPGGGIGYGQRAEDYPFKDVLRLCGGLIAILGEDTDTNSARFQREEDHFLLLCFIFQTLIYDTTY